MTQVVGMLQLSKDDLIKSLKAEIRNMTLFHEARMLVLKEALRTRNTAVAAASDLHAKLIALESDGALPFNCELLIGTRVSANHPITVLNPEKEFNITDVRRKARRSSAVEKTPCGSTATL